MSTDECIIYFQANKKADRPLIPSVWKCLPNKNALGSFLQSVSILQNLRMQQEDASGVANCKKSSCMVSPRPAGRRPCPCAGPSAALWGVPQQRQETANGADGRVQLRVCLKKEPQFASSQRVYFGEAKLSKAAAGFVAAMASFTASIKSIACNLRL